MITSLLARETRLPEEYVRLVARTATHRYKIYPIAKKNGGTRIIHHPARELKLFQGWIVARVISRLAAHPAAMAYRPGLSITDHARKHSGNNFLLKVDFMDFFPSIAAADIRLLLTQQGDKLRDLIQDGNDIDILIKLLCREGRLTIGAPSSPAVSNAVMFDFDAHWAARCEQTGITYTRYADDLYFSTTKPKVLPELFRNLDVHLKSRNSPKLRLNEQKTVFTSRKHRRMVTGITLTSTGAVSLGRNRKRKIKSLVHRYTKSQLTAPEVAYLKGLIAFANDVEPSFVGTLRTKYGAGAIGLIFS